MCAALDDWLPSPAVRTRHGRAAAAPADELWRAARTVRLSDTRRLGRMVRWRIPGLAADLTYHELFRAYPFCVLDETDHSLVSGLCGRIWTLSRDYPALAGAADFAAWDEPGTVRVAFAHWVARLRLKATWAVVGPFERLVGPEPLALAAARAEG
jgi:hypothetical protein